MVEQLRCLPVDQLANSLGLLPQEQNAPLASPLGFLHQPANHNFTETHLIDVPMLITHCSRAARAENG